VSLLVLEAPLLSLTAPGAEGAGITAAALTDSLCLVALVAVVVVLVVVVVVVLLFALLVPTDAGAVVVEVTMVVRCEAVETEAGVAARFTAADFAATAVVAAAPLVPLADVVNLSIFILFVALLLAALLLPSSFHFSLLPVGAGFDGLILVTLVPLFANEFAAAILAEVEVEVAEDAEVAETAEKAALFVEAVFDDG
jgi:hypothetical protein